MLATEPPAVLYFVEVLQSSACLSCYCVSCLRAGTVVSLKKRKWNVLSCAALPKVTSTEDGPTTDHRDLHTAMASHTPAAHSTRGSELQYRLALPIAPTELVT